ncbi:hypothetical protein P4V41_05630 [Fictibacillus nanhaiensis]|uniref:hypothetical protein n=1 Tax=Fictibacillus nanhaiensis TaxID=742169 RepID=UPI002E2474E2|nr:hypothetical protein [Fictibacillus nanhaiensis]
MPIIYRLFLLSGLLSILVGIVQITSLVRTKADGLNVWGYLLLLWGIVAFLCAINRYTIRWIHKLLAAVGALLHGTVVMYSLLFPLGDETKGMQFISFLYPIMSIISVCCCGFILGQKRNKAYSKTISK